MPKKLLSYNEHIFRPMYNAGRFIILIYISSTCCPSSLLFYVISGYDSVCVTPPLTSLTYFLQSAKIPRQFSCPMFILRSFFPFLSPMIETKSCLAKCRHPESIIDKMYCINCIRALKLWDLVS